MQSQRTGGSDSEDSEVGFLRRREEDHHSMDSDEEPLPTINNRAPPSFPPPLSPQLDHGEGLLLSFHYFRIHIFQFSIGGGGSFYYREICGQGKYPPPPRVFFSPLGHAIIVLSQTMYGGENMARGKSNHTMFHKIMGNLEKKCRP